MNDWKYESCTEDNNTIIFYEEESTLDFRLDGAKSEPYRAHSTDAGIDLSPKQDYLLPKNTRVLIDTGVSVKIPAGSFGLLVSRSSLSKKNIIIINSIGIIDAEYRGNLKANLMFLGDTTTNMEYATLSAGERILQLVVVPFMAFDTLNFVDCNKEEWENTQRGANGFGSTGKI
jgi:dUTP pyrophosphatase